MSEDGEKYLCTECIGDKSFSEFIENNGETGNCDFDEDHTNVKRISVKEFAGKVDDFFRENYCEGEEYPEFDLNSDKVYYARRGEPYDDIIYNEVLFENDGAFESTLDNLPGPSHRELTQGAQPFYTDTTYERIDDIHKRDFQDMEYWYQEQIDFKWNEFCDVVIYKSRFFKAKEMLDELFGNIEDYKESGVKFFKELKEGHEVSRSRIAKKEELQKIETSPSTELGIAPSEKAGHGRLNSEFIPVWYVSENPEVAIAEVKPSISDNICIGKFKLKKQVKLFDLTALQEKYPHKTGKECSRFEFILELDKQMSKPISPHEAKRDYIPTQVVTEYKRVHFSRIF